MGGEGSSSVNKYRLTPGERGLVGTGDARKGMPEPPELPRSDHLFRLAHADQWSGEGGG
jgi:hypothetical protein